VTAGKENRIIAAGWLLNGTRGEGATDNELDEQPQCISFFGNEDSSRLIVPGRIARLSCRPSFVENPNRNDNAIAENEEHGGRHKRKKPFDRPLQHGGVAKDDQNNARANDKKILPPDRQLKFSGPSSTFFFFDWFGHEFVELVVNENKSPALGGTPGLTMLLTTVRGETVVKGRR
jgi:hypothetical protein